MLFSLLLYNVMLLHVRRLNVLLLNLMRFMFLFLNVLRSNVTYKLDRSAFERSAF